MKRFLASVVFLLISFSCLSQDLNQYKYAVIPYKMDFLSKHDQYRVNSLVRYLFKKEGFEVLYNTEKLPADLVENRCLALYVDINNDSSIFITKMAFVLRDCTNKTILETSFGRTKIKAYEKAYNVALKEAFRDIEMKNYTYQPKKKEVVEVVVDKKEETPKVQENVTITVTEEKLPVQKTETKTETTLTVVETSKMMLYAQPIENGYQLVDSTPKVVMVLLKTGVPNVYLVKGQDASVYKEDGKWFLSTATSDGNVKSELKVKF